MQRSPDGSQVVTASTDGPVRVWNASKGAPVRSMPVGVIQCGVCWSSGDWTVSGGEVSFSALPLYSNSSSPLAGACRTSSPSSSSSSPVWGRPGRCAGFEEALVEEEMELGSGRRGGERERGGSGTAARRCMTPGGRTSWRMWLRACSESNSASFNAAFSSRKPSIALAAEGTASLRDLCRSCTNVKHPPLHHSTASPTSPPAPAVPRSPCATSPPLPTRTQVLAASPLHKERDERVGRAGACAAVCRGLAHAPNRLRFRARNLLAAN
jgi:hypothetical protein